MPDLESLRELLYMLGAVFFLAALLLMSWLYRRNAKPKPPPAANPFSNLTEIAVLFQTMRGVIHEQKTLAREFNESVDKKVQLIRQVVKRIIEEHERLTAAHQDLQRRVEALKASVGGMEEPSVQARAESPVESPPPPPEPAEDAKPLDAVANPSEAEDARDLIDRWVGLDFAFDETEQETMDDLDVPVATPQSREGSSEAVRALLSVPGNGGGRVADSNPQTDGGNGHNRAFLRTRVFDYYDAGMSVAQIAQELGIGKGEIRLMLSLRDKGKKD